MAIAKLEHLPPLRLKKMGSLTNDGREIRQPDNISLDSRKETTETQTVASRSCVRVTT